MASCENCGKKVGIKTTVLFKLGKKIGYDWAKDVWEKESLDEIKEIPKFIERAKQDVSTELPRHIELRLEEYKIREDNWSINHTNFHKGVYRGVVEYWKVVKSRVGPKNLKAALGGTAPIGYLSIVYYIEKVLSMPIHHLFKLGGTRGIWGQLLHIQRKLVELDFHFVKREGTLTEKERTEVERSIRDLHSEIGPLLQKIEERLTINGDEKIVQSIIWDTSIRPSVSFSPDMGNPDLPRKQSDNPKTPGYILQERTNDYFRGELESHPIWGREPGPKDKFRVEIDLCAGRDGLIKDSDLGSHAKAILDGLTSSGKIWKDDKLVDELIVERKCTGEAESYILLKIKRLIDKTYLFRDG